MEIRTETKGQVVEFNETVCGSIWVHRLCLSYSKSYSETQAIHSDLWNGLN